MDTLNDVHVEAFRKIAVFVNEFGLENFTVKKLKGYDSQLFHFICNRLGGLKAVRLSITTGEIDLNQYSASTDVSEKADKVIEKMKEDVYVDQSLIEVMSTPGEESENSNFERFLNPPVNMPNYDPFEEEELIVKYDVIMDILGQLNLINTRLDVVLSKQENLDEVLLTFAKSNPTSVDRMNEKLKVLENDMVDGVRERVSELVLKYCYIKFGNTNAGSVRKAYNDIYHSFNKVYDVNLDSIQLATINVVNQKRAREGKRAVDYIDPKVKGLRKIDIVERLGMLPELYIIVKNKLADALPEN